MTTENQTPPAGAQITEGSRLNLPIVLAVTALVGAGSAVWKVASFVAEGRAERDKTTEQIAFLLSENTERKKEATDFNVRFVRYEEDMRHMKEGVDELRRDMKDLLQAGGIRTAGGRAR